MSENDLNNNALQPSKLRVLIFGYKEFSQLMSSVLGRFREHAEFRIVDAIVGTTFEIKKHISAFCPDVVVSAGSNARYLESALSIPVASLATTELDIYEAVEKASKISDNIHVISFAHTSISAQLAGPKLNAHVEQTVYLTPEQAREQFYIASKKPEVVMVGASLVCGLAASKDIPSFLVYSESSCIETIESALEKAREWRERNREHAIMSWLMDKSKTPIIMIDGMDESLTLNNAAKHDLKLTNDFTSDLSTLIHPEGGKRLTDGECEINGKEWWYHLDTVDQVPNQKYIYQLYSKLPTAKAKKKAPLKRHELIYQSREMESVMQQAVAFASSPSNVLLFGESGTGKELVARQVHKFSPYEQGKFVALNCSAIPSELFEGELFGHQDGAYTGSRRGGRKGLIEEAQHGVLFLDEISELALDQQAKLLRFLQERQYRPLGGNQERDVDLKLIAASNRSLSDMVKTGAFREDLFYRLNVFNITLPPLRQRIADIPLVAIHKLASLNKRYALDHTPEDVWSVIEQPMLAYQWPGNIRELENVLERIVAYVKAMNGLDRVGSVLSQIAPELSHTNEVAGAQGGALKNKEYEMILATLEQCSGDKRRAAQALGISQTTLWRRLKDIQHNNND